MVLLFYICFDSYRYYGSNELYGGMKLFKMMIVHFKMLFVQLVCSLGAMRYDSIFIVTKQFSVFRQGENDRY
jgi:hypothetical protein